MDESMEFAKKQCIIPFKLKDKQVECISEVVEGKDTIGILPTGYGKSIIYTLLPFVLDHYNNKPHGHHVVVVISPLKALMEEQVQKINGMGVSAVYLGTRKMTEEQISGFKTGQYQIVMISPESLFSGKWRDVFVTDVYRDRVAVMTVDEAHCVVQWGKEFRRDYGRLGEMRAVFSKACMLALTASAPPSMIPQMRRSFLLESDTHIISHSSNRNNILYIAKEAPISIVDTFHWLVEDLQVKQQHCPKVIIYCRSIKAVGRLFTYFNDELGDSIYIGTRYSANRLVAMFTHATKQRIKDIVAVNFGKCDSNIRVVIATVAFGMGIDCPDVSIVINWGASRTFESFYQESGRAGRDPSMQAYSIAYYRKSDVTELATDDKMRDYCYGKDSSVVQDMGTEEHEEEDDSDLEDIFGTIRVIDTPEKKVESKPAVCRRKLICKHLTPNETVTLHEPVHLCCDLCHAQCKCGNCLALPGVDLEYVRDSALLSERVSKHDVPVRSVTKEQQKQLQLRLVALRDSSPHASGFFGGDIHSGLDDHTIKEIVCDSHNIFDDFDIQAHLYDPQQIKAVMEVIHDFFADN